MCRSHLKVKVKLFNTFKNKGTQNFPLYACNRLSSIFLSLTHKAFHSSVKCVTFLKGVISFSLLCLCTSFSQYAEICLCFTSWSLFSQGLLKCQVSRNAFLRFLRQFTVVFLPYNNTLTLLIYLHIAS